MPLAQATLNVGLSSLTRSHVWTRKCSGSSCSKSHSLLWCSIPLIPSVLACFTLASRCHHFQMAPISMLVACLNSVCQHGCVIACVHERLYVDMLPRSLVTVRHAEMLCKICRLVHFVLLHCHRIDKAVVTQYQAQM